MNKMASWKYAITDLIMTGLVSVATAWPIQLCWNRVITKVFDLPVIDFIDAMCLMILATLLIKSKQHFEDRIK